MKGWATQEPTAARRRSARCRPFSSTPRPARTTAPPTRGAKEPWFGSGLETPRPPHMAGPSRLGKRSSGKMGGMKRFLLLFCLGFACTAAAAAEPGPDGVMFACAPAQIAGLERDMSAYLRELGIGAAQVVKTTPDSGTLVYTLATPEADTDTLSLKQRKEYRIRDEFVRLPTKGGKTRLASTASKKEILLALLQHGRLTRFSGAACTLDALREQVGVRQNVAAWTRQLSWIWPDGGPASWNPRLWRKGTPLASVGLDRALQDPFLNQARYGIGCYTASKLSYAHAVLDYYARVKKDPAKAALVRARLLHDQEPLVGVEPAAMWDFEQDFDPATPAISGKLLSIERGIPSR